MRYCYITKKHGGMYIDCSYDPDFLEVLKSSVPAHSRKYDQETKQLQTKLRWEAE